MKKVYMLILTFAVVFIGLLYLSSLKVISNQFKAIYQSYGYVYKEDKRMQFELYSEDATSVIENTSINSYYILSNDINVLLNNVEVTKEKQENYYLYRITCDIFKPLDKELKIKDAVLKIETDQFNIEIIIGSLSIFNDDVELLSFNDIYASYTYINGSLMLCGINLGLNENYNRISNLSVNGMTYTDSSMIVDGTFYGNEIEIKKIIPNYEYSSILRSHRKIETNKLFIPVTYKNLIVIKGGYLIITLDGINYLINEFDFIFNDLDINDYEKYIRESINVKA